MIVGNGLIAKAFSYYKKDSNIIIFASGVSNSQCKDINEFYKEVELLQNNLKVANGKLFVYFSSCSISDISLNNSLYVKHKLNTEEIIKNSGNRYLIIRTSNPIGFTNNPNTLLNYLHTKINNQEIFDLWLNSKRNLIDVEDLFKITKYIIEESLYLNEIINVANIENIYVKDIVCNLENKIGKKGKYNIVNNGGSPNIDTDKILDIVKALEINFKDNYILNLINKYY